MARFIDMVPDVRGAAYGAPDDILIRALVRATQELCKSSQCWREELDATYAQDGVGAYEFSAPYETSVDRVIWVKVGGRQVCRQSRPDDLLARPASTGFPRVFAQDSHRQTIHVWPAPGPDEIDSPIVVYAVLSPTLRTTWLPDGLVDEYQQGLVAAAKADLLLNSPDMPWHDPQNALVQRAIADSIFTRAKRAQHSGHSMPLTVAARRFI